MRPRLDPELGVTKKDDDLYVKKNGGRTGWRARGAPRLPLRRTFKRLGLMLLLGLLVYVFVHNIPTDLGPQDHRHPFYAYPNPTGPPGAARPNTFSPIPNGAPMPAASKAQDYDGPVRFLELAGTLHAISDTKGSSPVNDNVLYMASTIKSANKLLPIACEMSKELRSYVHFALVSRSEIPMKALRDMNGIGDDCHIIFHDARSEFSASSSDERFAKAIVRGIYHINNYMHPQAVLVDAEAEELSFLSAARDAVATLSPAAFIELPAGSEDRLSWITKLDAASLSHFNRFSVDILIHAHKEASGSLIRLLKTLSDADYTACAIPHITIELPEQIDIPTQQFLKDFRWPPPSAQNPLGSNQLLTLRHRISSNRLSEEESAVRFLEGFWPTNPRYSHVLVLSPQVELSPNYFHYLKMSLLEYLYSGLALTLDWDKKLLGISLDLPSAHISGSGPFTPPTKPLEDGQVDMRPEAGTPTPFLWQAPNSNAILFTGTKWAELHDFVSKSLEAQHAAASPLALLAEKLVSKDYPAWLEYVLRLCRAQGYWTVYPSPQMVANLAIVHNELYRQPEEYENDREWSRHNDGDEIVIHKESLLDSLPADGMMPNFQAMPLLAWDGTNTTVQQVREDARAYAAAFRNSVGGCAGVKVPETEYHLFCGGDEGI